MNINSLRAREVSRLESLVGMKAAVHFIVRLYVNGPVHIETVIQSLKTESMRVLALKRSLNKRMR